MSLAAVPNGENPRPQRPRLRLVPPPAPAPAMTQRERVILSLIRCPEPSGSPEQS
jgi:hypothetical protein